MLPIISIRIVNRRAAMAPMGHYGLGFGLLTTGREGRVIKVGKRVGHSTYVHLDARAALSEEQRARIAEAARLAGVVPEVSFNVVRFGADGDIALLAYADFFDEPFPALQRSWRVHPDSGEVGYRTYADSFNPPILHRKELLLPLDHPRREEYAALTAAAEAIGLFDDTTRIGYQRQWLALVRERGYRIDGHQLLPLGNVEGDANVPDEAQPDTDQIPLGSQGHDHWQAARQRTAMVRYGFSAPIQSLARHGFLDGTRRLFDYGCGRGDDVRGLQENAIPAQGWDPYYAPEQPLASTDIVNLGFVINVIEDPDERREALVRAWSLAETLLVVSVMIGERQHAGGGAHFADGLLTQRGTFQKYYSPAEIRQFLTSTLDEEPITVAPGVLYVFRDKDAEQRFLLQRCRGRRNRLRAPSVPRLREPQATRRDRQAERYAAQRESLERLWAQRLTLGRPPHKDETADLLALTAAFGRLSKALRFVEDYQRAQQGSDWIDAVLEQAAEARRADLEVYLALRLFERRRPYKQLEPGLQRDIKAFFGDYPSAQQAGLALLRAIADPEAIAAACRQAAEHGLGWLEPERSLQLHVSLVDQLPALLRVYVGAGAVLYGEVQQADLIKIHIPSGKLTLLIFDAFDGQALPRLRERIKIKLREQGIDIFDYVEPFTPPYLLWKSRYINEEHPDYPEQLAFDEQLAALGLFDLSGYGPAPEVLEQSLARARWEVQGLRLTRSETAPALDDPCGRFLRFADLILCGETQAATGLANLPKQPESWNALLELAEQVLDPVIDWFGMIRLTYGFCSPGLARQIPARIDPKRDQHAAHERNRLGKPICPRLGAAVDFLIEDENMREVAHWIATHTPFDRLYFYEPDLPLHVSYGPEHSRQIVLMRPGPSGRLVPRVVSAETLLQVD